VKLGLDESNTKKVLIKTGFSSELKSFDFRTKRAALEESSRTPKEPSTDTADPTRDMNNGFGEITTAYEQYIGQALTKYRADLLGEFYDDLGDADRIVKALKASQQASRSRWKYFMAIIESDLQKQREREAAKPKPSAAGYENVDAFMRS
jgi:hypothetical protein